MCPRRSNLKVARNHLFAVGCGRPRQQPELYLTAMEKVISNYWTARRSATNSLHVGRRRWDDVWLLQLFASHQFDVKAKTMANSIIDRSQRENIDLARESASEQKLVSLRILQSENQRLRDLVVSLSAALVRNLALDLGSERRAASTADARPSDIAAGNLPTSFPGHEQLTSRERAVLAQILKGASSKEAARTLAISARTVESHRANILLKLGAKNTAELVRIVLGE
jgi:DNA-binding CsgD family transcriptional regulator